MILMGGLLVVVSATLDSVFRRMLAARLLYLHCLFHAHTNAIAKYIYRQRITNNHKSGPNSKTSQTRKHPRPPDTWALKNGTPCLSGVGAHALESCILRCNIPNINHTISLSIFDTVEYSRTRQNVTHLAHGAPPPHPPLHRQHSPRHLPVHQPRRVLRDHRCGRSRSNTTIDR